MKRVFADTSYFIALLVPNDVAHARAAALADEPRRLVTSAWVMTELATYFAHPRHRPLFIALLAAVRFDANVEFIPATPDLFDRGTELYAARTDKEWLSIASPS